MAARSKLVEWGLPNQSWQANGYQFKSRGQSYSTRRNLAGLNYNLLKKSVPSQGRMRRLVIARDAVAVAAWLAMSARPWLKR